MNAFHETSISSAYFRNHYNEISKQCRDNNEAVVITANGRGDTVSLSYETYQLMKARIELLEILAESDEDIQCGRVEPIENTFSALRERLKGEA